MKPSPTPVLPRARKQHAILVAALAAAGIAALVLGRHVQAGPDPIAGTELERAARAPARTTCAEATRTPVVSVSSAAAGWYAAQVGTAMSFTLQASHHCELIRRDSGAITGGGQWRIAGSMSIAIVQRRPGEAIAEVAFPGVRIAIADGQAAGVAAGTPEQAQRVESALGQPFLVRIDTDGRVLGYRFPTSFGFFEKGYARVVLAQLCFVVPPSAGSAWTVRDTDDTGTFEAQYEWQPGSPAAEPGLVARRKLHYLRLAGGADAGCKVRLDSRATAQLSRKIGWLTRADVDERATVSLHAMAVDARTVFRGALALQSVAHVALALAADAWEGPWEASACDPSDAAAVALETEREQWRKKLEGVDLATLVAQIERMFATGATGGPEYRAAWEALTWLFQLDPRAVDRAAEQVAGGTLSLKVASALLTALGCAGTEAAQRVLTRFHEHSGLAAAVRDAATVALVQVEKPSVGTLSAMVRTLTQGATADKLGNTTMLVLGALAVRCAEPLAGGRTALQQLIALEQPSRERGCTDTWLHALGNSGAPGAVEHAEPYFHHASERVREAAAAAVRKVPSERACELLAGLARTDKADAVRAQAVDSLADHGTPRARAMLCEVLRRDAAVDVRRAAMLGLGRRIDDAAREALEHVMCADPSDELKQLAGELLTRS